MSGEKNMFLASGKGSGDAALVRFFGLALKECGCPRPRVAYIGTASGDNEPFFRMMEKHVLKAGAAEVVFLRLATSRPDAETARRQIAACSAVFINGGEVYDGMAGLWNAGLDDYLRRQFHEGKVFIGLSAGAIMIGRNWIALKGENGRNHDELFPCLGLAPASFDAHAEDEDWIELKTLLRLQGPGSEGRAIPTGGMLRIDRSGMVTDLSRTKSFLFRNTGGQVLAEPVPLP